MRQHIPNLLTTSRIFLALLFPFVSPNFWIFIIAIAGITEYLDGFLARLWNVVSKLGVYLDPIADKTLLVAIVFTYLAHDKLTILELLLIGLRDLTILSGCLWLVYKKEWERFQLMEPVYSGKVATWAQYIFFIYVAIWQSLHPFVLWGTVFVSAWAGSDYIQLFLKQEKEFKQKCKNQKEG